MKLIINGESTLVARSGNISEMLDCLKYTGDFIAVAVNGVAVPRREHASTALAENDEIEILSPMQGG